MTKRGSFSLLALGIILLAVALVFMGRINREGFDYDASSIVYDTRLYAIHEMSGSTVDQIPFFPTGNPQPRVAISEDFHNFGEIGPAERVSYDFVIANQGEAPLTIFRAYTTCGCTTAAFTGTRIPPGKVILVTLTLDAGYHDVRGQTVRRGVIIEVNDPLNPQVELWAQASVREGQ